MPTTTKFDRGAYRVEYRGRRFTVESRSYRAWLAGDAFTGIDNWVLCEDHEDGRDGYWNDFATKRDAVAAVRLGCDEDC